MVEPPATYCEESECQLLRQRGCVAKGMHLSTYLTNSSTCKHVSVLSSYYCSFLSASRNVLKISQRPRLLADLFQSSNHSASHRCFTSSAVLLSPYMKSSNSPFGFALVLLLPCLAYALAVGQPVLSNPPIPYHHAVPVNTPDTFEIHHSNICSQSARAKKASVTRGSLASSSISVSRAKYTTYSYTTAIRSLSEEEHAFFGPLGYHSRPDEQRASDRTHSWFIPKQTMTVGATTTVELKAPVTKTVYMTLTETQAAAPIVSKAILLETGSDHGSSIRVRRAVRGGSLPDLVLGRMRQNLKPGNLQDFVYRHSSGVRKDRSVAQDQGEPPDRVEMDIGRPEVDAQAAAVDGSSLCNHPDEDDAMAVKEATDANFAAHMVHNVAQITGYIVGFLVISAVVVLVLVWCSQSLCLTPGTRQYTSTDLPLPFKRSLGHGPLSMDGEYPRPRTGQAETSDTTSRGEHFTCDYASGIAMPDGVWTRYCRERISRFRGRKYGAAAWH
jgi:hypothetical protein